MTGREMQIAFERSIHTVDPTIKSFGKIESTDIFFFINLAIHYYIKETFLSQSSMEENVVMIQKNSNALGKLIRREELDVINQGALTQAFEFTNKYAVPDEFFYYVDSAVNISKIATADGTTLGGTTASQWIGCDLINVFDSNKYKQTARNRPILDKPKVLFLDTNDDTAVSYIYVIYDQFTEVSTFELMYIKTPTVVSVSANCDLDVTVHDDIVRTAQKLFIEEYKYKLSKKE